MSASHSPTQPDAGYSGLTRLTEALPATYYTDPARHQRELQAIWSEISDDQTQLPPDKPLTVVAYSAGEPKRAYVEPIAVGDSMPSLPIFLDEGTYVPAPLEQTYQLTWSKCPQPVRELVEAKA